VQTADGWKTVIVPGAEKRHTVPLADGKKAQAVVVSAVSRLSREGPAERAEVTKGGSR
jgi:hypothetical protein